MYQVYKSVVFYAKFHETDIEFGSITLNNKHADLLTEKEFDIQFNKHKFVMCKLKDNHHVAFVTIGSDQESLIKIAGSEQNLLIVYSDEKNKILNKIPNISCQSFLTQLKHQYSPVSLKKIDFSVLEKLLMIKKKDLPKLIYNSPETAWYRFNKGDVVEIVYYSPIGGLNTEYRYVE